MTKIIGLLLCFHLASAMQAQIRKNTVLLGGQFSYYNGTASDNNGRDEESSSGMLGLRLATAFKTNSLFGINASFSPSKQKNISTGTDMMHSKSKRYEVGLFFREYKQLARDFYFFGQVDANAIIGNLDVWHTTATAKYKRTDRGGYITLTPGVAYQVFKKMHLEITIPNVLGVNYIQTKFDQQDSPAVDSKQRQYGVYSNVNNSTSLGWLGVGFHFLL